MHFANKFESLTVDLITNKWRCAEGRGEDCRASCIFEVHILKDKTQSTNDWEGRGVLVWDSNYQTNIFPSLVLVCSKKENKLASRRRHQWTVLAFCIFLCANNIQKTTVLLKTQNANKEKNADRQMKDFWAWMWIKRGPNSHSNSKIFAYFVLIK